MSLCSHTLRASLRSRASHPNTLLPFLYQTATIQQWKSATQPIARHNISSLRPKATDDIPFEDADGRLPPTFEEARSAQKTTMTNNERAAFEKLYKTFNTRGRGQARDQGSEHEELDQIADEYYEDDEDGLGNSLDKVFDEALQGSMLRTLNARRSERNAPSWVQRPSQPALSSKHAPAPEADASQNRKKAAAKAEKERIRNIRIQERERIDTLLTSAQTDLELWQLLDREVFSQLRKLDLDDPNSAKKEQRPKHQAKATLPPNADDMDTRILFPNYPHHLATAVKTLRYNFPRSHLPLAILHTVKSLGRSSYALGATTQLYTHLLRTAWVQQSSYTLVDTLLTDMDSNMVGFDPSVLEVLDGIIREHDMATTGQLGKEMQMVLGTEMWTEAMAKIHEWRRIVAERLGIRLDKIDKATKPPAKPEQKIESSIHAAQQLVDGPQHAQSDANADADANAHAEAEAEAEAEGKTDAPSLMVTPPSSLDNTHSPLSDGNAYDRISHQHKSIPDVEPPAKILL